jgi:hypothetical protein
MRSVRLVSGNWFPPDSHFLKIPLSSLHCIANGPPKPRQQSGATRHISESSGVRYPIPFWRDPFQPLAISLSSFLIWIRCFGLNGRDG